MSKHWDGLLPEMNKEFMPILLNKRLPTESEVERLKVLKRQAGENCQIILRGLAAVGAALVESHEELTDAEKCSLGYLMQYMAHLGADLAHIEVEAAGYLADAPEVANG